MKAIMTDVTKCVGCEKCVTACVKENNLSKALPWRWINKDGLSSERFTSVLRKPEKHYVRKQCRHCLEPACVSSCPVGALQKTKDGPVIYDSGKCMGCRYCMMACPYGIPRYSWEDAVPYVRKCTMCYPRIKKNELPACVSVCQEKATIFGERDVLIAEAKRRIKNSPDKYINKVYGETEVGGTSVIYISDIPLDFLGWEKTPGVKPLPSLTRYAMNAVPPVFLGMGALMFGLYKFSERRSQIQDMSKKTDRSIEDETENS